MMRLLEPPLLTADAIQARVRQLGVRISEACAGQELVVIVVLKGSIVFAADLIRAMTVPVTLDYIRAKSYVGTEPGALQFSHLPDTRLEGRHVLLVEDILDTGRTCEGLLAHLATADPASIRICTLLDKPARREVPVEADFVGFRIDDHFVVGYGLDFNERYRELPAVHVLK